MKKRRKKGMVVRRLPGLMTAGLVMTAALAGCGSAVQTEEEIVTPKETEQGILQETVKVQGGIKEQVQAPERWQDSFGNDRVTVTADASVAVPEAEGFRTKRVVSRPFTQEDYDTVNRVLLDGGALWDRDADAMKESNGFTRQEIEERITQLEEKMASGVKGSETYGGKEITFEEQLAGWKSMLAAAPEEAVTREIPAVVKWEENAEASEGNNLSGTVTCKGQDYCVWLNNDLRDDFRWIKFEIRRSDVGGNFMDAVVPTADKSALEGQTDAIRQSAAELVKKLGLEELSPAGEEYVAVLSGDEENNGTIEQTDVGYAVHFTRVVDGIPVTWTQEDGNTSEGDWSTWPYEELTVIYDDEGLAEFTWTDPYELSELSEDYVFLLPFEDISRTAKELILKKYEDYGEPGWKIDMTIEEARLGYMRIMEKGNPKEGTMVPVWDFFGSLAVETEDEEGNPAAGKKHESLLAVNAMDGTIIDRSLGY